MMNRFRNDTRRRLACAPVALLIACGPADADRSDSTDSQLPPPAAALSRGSAGALLGERLERLEADLAAAVAGGNDDESQAYLLRAEAATDRLLEDEPEHGWLASGYLVEARLRQIQALADRVVSEMRRGVARELVLEDVAALRLSVADLRAQLAQPGNGAPPPSLDSLLASVEETPAARTAAGTGSADTSSATTTTTPAAPAPATGGDGALGEPIQP